GHRKTCVGPGCLVLYFCAPKRRRPAVVARVAPGCGLGLSDNSEQAIQKHCPVPGGWRQIRTGPLVSRTMASKPEGRGQRGIPPLPCFHDAANISLIITWLCLQGC